MEDPTTLALNLTFFGTLGMAFLMFLGLLLCMAATLVLAGLARLLSILVLAMVGILPKNDADPVVHLPSSHTASAEPAAEPATADADYAPAPDEAPAGGDVSGAPVEVPAAPRPGFLESAAQLVAALATALRSVPWKKLLSPNEWPPPGQLRSRIAEGTAAAVENQTKHHPLLLAATHEPPALNAEWAAAVAEADAREEAREEAREVAHVHAREKSAAGSR